MSINRPNDPEYEILRKYIFGDAVINKNDKVSISDFYDFIFGDKSNPKPIKFMAPKKPKKNSSDQPQIPIVNRKTISPEEIEKRKNEEIQNKLNQFKQSLSQSVLSNPNFRNILRQANAKTLEINIYENATDDLKSEPAPQYKYPTDDEIKVKFEALNSEYNFFDKSTKDYINAMNQFVVLFKGCKLIADYAENNNNEDNSLASLHAYKILVFFGAGKVANRPFTNLEEYLKQHKGYDQPHPIHDALITHLPKNINHEIHDLAGWQKFIAQYGLKGMQYFQNASAIEMHLNNKAPKNLKEAAKAAAKITYKNYAAYPALAKLCMQFNINEDTFNKCLEIDKKRKLRDNLPDQKFDVDGKTVSDACSGYYLVKLPIDDPRAYLLGHLTNCCQSVGGNSEECVIDGITRENNGFYVLLKSQSKSNTGKIRLDNGSINYKEFDIVGQGYAWLGRAGNLTFDSWENLRPAQIMPSCGLLKLSDELITSSISDLKSVKEYRSKHYLSDMLILHKNKLFYINFRKNELTEISLTNDKNQQLLLLFDQLKENKCKPADDKILPDIARSLGSSQDDAIACSMLTRFSEKVTADNDSEMIRVTIGSGGKTPAEFKSKERAVRRSEIMAEGYQYGDSIKQSHVYFNTEKQERIFNSLLEEFDQKGKYLSEYVESFNSLILGSRSPKELFQKEAEWIRSLFFHPESEAQWREILGENKSRPALRLGYNLENIESMFWEALFLMNKAGILNQANFESTLNSNADIISSVVILQRTGILNDTNFRALINHDKYAKDISSILAFLQEASILNNNNYQAVMDHSKYAKYTSRVLSVLQHSAILNDTNFQTFIANIQDVKVIGNGLITLFKADILNKDNYEAILNHIQDAEALSDALVSLHKAGALNNDNRQTILNHIQDAEVLSYALVTLHEAGILNNDNRQTILNHIQDAEALSDALVTLHEAGILNNDNRQTILNHIQDAEALSDALVTLHEAGILNNDNRQTILNHIQDAEALSGALVTLHEAGILNNDNRQAILNHVEDAEAINGALVTLHEAGILNNDNYQAILNHVQDAEALGDALVTLHVATDILSNPKYDNVRQETLSQPNFNAAVSNALVTFHEAGILDDHNYGDCQKYMNLAQYTEAISHVLLTLRKSIIDERAKIDSVKTVQNEVDQKKMLGTANPILHGSTANMEIMFHKNIEGAIQDLKHTTSVHTTAAAPQSTVNEAKVKVADEKETQELNTQPVIPNGMRVK